MTRSRIAGITALLVTGLIGAGGCGRSDVTYVSNKDAGFFLKVPDNWTVYQVNSGNVAADIRIEVEGSWSVYLDSADPPARSHIEDPNPGSPIASIVIVPLTRLEANGEAPSATHAALRSMVLNGEADPLIVGAAGEIAVDEYVETEFDNGYWGNHITVQLPLSDGTVMTITQLAYFDGSLSRLYRLQFLCNQECYAQHEAEIDEIIDSLTLKNP
jgi:hypothetical protein